MSMVSDDELYEDTYAFVTWSETVFARINQELSMRKRPQLKLAKWKSAISYYLLEITNFNDDIDEIYLGLLRFVSAKTGIHSDEISKIMLNAESRVKRFDAIMGDVKITRTPNDDVQIKIGVVTQVLPKNRYLLLNEEHDHLTPSLKSLILRYAMLDISTGYFWSVEPKLYRLLEDDSNFTFGQELPVLECFASPFNYSIRNYCSMFEDDRDVPNPPGVECKGNFFDYVKILEESRIPVRLLFNPPYTGRILTKSIMLLLDYLRAVPEAEVVAMLPNWQDFQPISDLIRFTGTAMHVMEESTFKVYDFASDTAFSPHNTALLLITNFAQNHSRSQSALNFSVQTLNAE